MEDSKIYWGIQCRTCMETIALGRRSDLLHGVGYVLLKPGTFKCVHGHKHTYHSDDLHFFTPEADISEEALERNRQRYKYLENPS
jgi:hypothetical protein